MEAEVEVEEEKLKNRDLDLDQDQQVLWKAIAKTKFCLDRSELKKDQGRDLDLNLDLDPDPMIKRNLLKRKR